MSELQRRTILTGIGSGIAGLTGGAYLLTRSTDPAAASVSMGELEITGAEETTENGHIEDVSATVSGSWAYEIPGGDVDRWVVQLQVSDGDEWAVVGQTSASQRYHTYDGEYQVSGSITETPLFSQDFFAAPGPGQQTNVELPLRVVFELLNVDDEPLAQASIEDTATVTVAQEQIDASLHGEVSGEGSLEITA